MLPMLFKFRVSPWLWDLAWVGVLIFCAGFQPLRARKNADRAPTPFVDQDFGHKELPIVFENSYYFVQSAFYGQGPGIAFFKAGIRATIRPAWSSWQTCRKRFSPWTTITRKRSSGFSRTTPS